MLEYFKKWREIGIVLYDPRANEGVTDSELWFSVVYRAIGEGDIALASALLASRNFGLTVTASPKFGYRLEGIDAEFKPYYTECFMKSKDTLIKILKELAEEFPAG